MSRTLEYQLKGKSDVEQVVGRAQKSMKDFGKQVESMGQQASKTPVSNLEKNLQGIASRFKMAGKDLFLSFFGPMVLLNTALNFISGQIEQRRRQIEDARKFAEESESKFLKPETKGMAQEIKARSQEKEEKRMAAEAEKQILIDMLSDELGRPGFSLQSGVDLAKGLKGYDVAQILLSKLFGTEEGVLSDILEDPQKREHIKSFLMKQGASQPTTTAKQELSADAKAVSGNVIGVGQSPVIAAMNEHTKLLEEIAFNTRSKYTPETPDINLTNKAPSRATQLMGK